MSPCFSVLISNFCVWVVVSFVFLKWFSAPTLFGFFHLSCSLNSCNQNTRFGTGTVRSRTTLTGFRGCLLLRVIYSDPNQVSGIPPSLQEQPVRTVVLQLCSAAIRTVARAMFPKLCPSASRTGGSLWVGCWLCWSHWDHILVACASIPSFGAALCGSYSHAKIVTILQKVPGGSRRVQVRNMQV